MLGTHYNFENNFHVFNIDTPSCTQGQLSATELNNAPTTVCFILKGNTAKDTFSKAKGS